MSYPEPSLTLNLCRIKLSAEKLECYQSSYNQDSFEEYQESYPNSIFQRQGNSVYCIPRFQGAKVYGRSIELTLDKNNSVFLRLIKEGLVQAYSNSTIKFVNFFSKLQFIDLSENLLESIDQKLTGIHAFPKYTIQPTSIGFGRKQSVCLILDVSTSIDLSLPLSEISEELDVTNLFAISKGFQKIPNGDKVHYTKLQGRIKSVQDGLVTFFENKNECKASECYLEPSKANRKHMVKSLVGQGFEAISRKIDQKIAEVVSGKGRYSRAIRQIDYLKKVGKVNSTDSFYFSVEGDLIRVGADFSRYNWVQRPLFIFDPAKSKKDTWANRGLMTHGPFDSLIFPKKNPKVIVLYPRQKQSEVTNFLTIFRDGVDSPYFSQGFVRKYHLDSIQYETYPFDLDQQNIAKSYENACLNALSSKNDYDLAITFIEERYHSPLFLSDPYLVTKSIFMSHGIPVQEIKFETLNKYGFSYSLDNIGLACYAKLGGIPCTISAINDVDHELVLGLGTALIRDTRLAEATRFVGITAVFGSDGNYLFSNLSNEIDYANYPKELTFSIKQVVSEVAKREAWTKDESLRLVIHQTFKRFSRNELTAIKQAIKEICDFETQFAFVTIGHENPITLFDMNQNSYKGSFIPERGFVIPDKDNSTLLTVIGPKQMLTPESAFPKPLTINVHRESTYNNVELLTKQVYDFTALSWRAFNPTDVPVTVLYSNLIADLMGRLRPVKNWNANIIQSKLRYSRWFL